jgi:MFS transporter, DHA2 family, multidrug resistance protein
MAVLDISISNSSMRDIQGTLAVSLDEGSWISTAYIVAEIVVIPLSGWLAGVFSLRKFLMFNVVVFVLASVACGQSKSLGMMIGARVVQGLSGGVFLPLSTLTVLTLLPPAKRTTGLLFFSLATSMAPALGPSLGGWITTNYGWEFSYFINIIPGLIMIAAIYFCLDPSPVNLDHLRRADWPGILMMAIGLGTLTYVLEEGNRKDWFGDERIQKATVVCVVALILFLWFELRAKHPFIELRLIKNRTTGICLLAFILMGLAQYGSGYLNPRFLLEIQGYNAYQAGRVMMWQGFSQLLVAPFLPFLIRNTHRNILVFVGFVLVGVSAYLNADLTHWTEDNDFIWSNIVRAVGTQLVITPLISLAQEGVANESYRSLSALISASRNLGGSLSIAGACTFLDHRYHLHFARIAEKITRLPDTVAPSFLAAKIASEKLDLLTLGKVINRESMIMSYSDVYLSMTVAMLVAACISLMIRPKRP